MEHLKASRNATGSWQQVFGKGPQTDELFMAYHYAHYLNHVAAAGKGEYSIPLYTNVWQNYVSGDSDNDFPIIAGGGGRPGDYPSGGGTSNLLDVWQRFASCLDFISPVSISLTMPPRAASTDIATSHCLSGTSVVMSTARDASGLHMALSGPLACPRSASAR